MRVQVDDARRQDLPSSIDRLCRSVADAADRRDPAVLDRQIPFHRRVAEPVGDTGISNDQIVHRRTLLDQVKNRSNQSSTCSGASSLT